MIVNVRNEKYDVYIGRPSKWGNPFVIGRHGNREEVIAKYRKYILNKPELLAEVFELEGLTLGCYCAPLACHGDVLEEIIAEMRGK